MGKNGAIACIVIGAIMAIAGLVKASIIGFYPSETWWTVGLVLVGGLLLAFGRRVHQNLTKD